MATKKNKKPIKKKKLAKSLKKDLSFEDFQDDCHKIMDKFGPLVDQMMVKYNGSDLSGGEKFSCLIYHLFQFGYMTGLAFNAGLENIIEVHSEVLNDMESMCECPQCKAEREAEEAAENKTVLN